MHDCCYLDLVPLDAVDNPILLKQQFTKVMTSELGYDSADFGELNQRFRCRHDPLGEESGVVFGVAPDVGTDVSQVSDCRRRPN